MARIAKNSLRIIPLADGRFFLTGSCEAKQYRLKFADDPQGLGGLQQAEAKKAELEGDAAKVAILEASKPNAQYTWLDEEQIKDAQAAFSLLKGRRHTLQECVLLAVSVLGEGTPKDATEAKGEFIAWQTKRKLSHFTIETNRRRIEEFLKFTGVKMLAEITPEHCEDFVNGDEDHEASTRTGRGRPIQTWLNWCVEKMAKKPSYLKASPFEVNMKELNEQASHKTHANKRMYSPEKCEALLKAAIAYNNGEMVPYTVLTLWCYMRHAEALRTPANFMHLDAASSLEGPFVEVYGRKKGSKPRPVNIPANVLPLMKQCMDRGLIFADWWREPGKKYDAKQLEVFETYGAIPYTRHGWDKIREAAGIIRFGGLTKNKYRAVLWTDWQENILRHTGESYARRQKDDAARVSRSAGHGSSTADKNYICIPNPGWTEKFYGIDLRLPALKKETAAVA